MNARSSTSLLNALRLMFLRMDCSDSISFRLLVFHTFILYFRLSLHHFYSQFFRSETASRGFIQGLLTGWPDPSLVSPSLWLTKAFCERFFAGLLATRVWWWNTPLLSRSAEGGVERAGRREKKEGMKNRTRRKGRETGWEEGWELIFKCTLTGRRRHVVLYVFISLSTSFLNIIQHIFSETPLLYFAVS